MDPTQNAKFPLHEAAREGKSELLSIILYKAPLTVDGSSTCGVFTERK